MSLRYLSAQLAKQANLEFHSLQVTEMTMFPDRRGTDGRFWGV